MSTQIAPNQPEASSQSELLAQLSALARQLDELEAGSVDETAALRLSFEMTRIAHTALLTVTALERLDTVEQASPTSDRDWEPETWVGIRAGAAGPARLADVCFACSFDLSSALRALDRARDHDGRLSAVEAARRKLYRALHAIASIAPGAEPLLVREALDQRVDDELVSALAVRRLYAEFRRNLRRPEQETNEAVLTALRYAAGALATLTASAHYSAVRVSDAALLRSQRERLLQWSRSGKPRAAGLQLLEDISTSASLLRDINRRQELRAHDAELIRGLLASPSLDRAGWLTELDRLFGLDDELDRLTAQLRARAGKETIAEILQRLSALI